MRRFLAALAACSLLIAAPAAAEDWLPADPVSTTAGAPDIAVNARGDAVAAWSVAGIDIEASFRPVGGAWSAPVTFTGTVVSAPEVAIGPDGTALVSYDENGDAIVQRRNPATGLWGFGTSATSGGRASVAVDGQGNSYAAWIDNATGDVVVATAPAGGPFGAPEFVSPAGAPVATQTSIAAAGGSAIAGWTRNGFIETAVRPPGGPWGSVDIVSGPTSSQSDVALDAAGNAAAAYLQDDAGLPRAATAFRPAGGTWELNGFVGPAGVQTATGPQMEIDGQGNAVAAFVSQAGPDRVDASVRPPGGAFGPPEPLSDSGLAGTLVRLGATGGAPTATWVQSTATTPRIAGRTFRSGAWTARKFASANFASFNGPPNVGADDEGNAQVVFADNADDGFTAVLDAAPPTLALMPAPATAPEPGQAVPFAIATPSDRWSAVGAISWDFGDGTGAAGEAVEHSYATPGSYTARVTVADALGNTASAEQAVSVQAPPAAPSQPPAEPPVTLPPPVLGRLVNAVPVSGRVRVRPPGTRRFVALSVARQIPMGSIVDARKGRVRITATDGLKTFSAEFYEGMFRITQSRRRGAITNLFLYGGSFRGCPRAPKVRIAAKRKAASKTRSVRHLWGDGTGKFRTVGRFSAATLRGTKWLTDDRCNGTRTRVTKGSVLVRDFVKRRNVLLRARPGSRRAYFARPRARN